ncbi:MAG: histidine triad nucleotide-binding protein [Patescibacteria group bacterium]|jgi:histidine triad (HIT) family protein
MNDCIFCKIINKEIPATVINETDDFIVIKDIQPKAPIHLLIITKKHIQSLSHLEAGDQALMGKMVEQAKQLAEKSGLLQRGFKLVVNCGPEGGQLVPHLHFHFLGGEKLDHLA